MIELIFLRRWLLILVLTIVLSPARSVASDDLPLRVRNLIVQTQQLMELEQYDKALELLEPQWQLGEHHYLVDFTVGNIYLLSQRHIEAIPWYRAVVQKQPEYRGAWLNLAQCYYVQEQYALAAEAFEQGYKLSIPRQPTLRYNAALAYLQAGKFEHSLVLLKRLVVDYPDEDHTAWRIALVQGYSALDQPLNALPHVEILAQTTTATEQRRWRELLIQHYLLLKMVDKALIAANHYVQVDGLEPLWWKLLTSIHLDAGRYSEGLVALKVLAYLQPLSEQEQHLLADLYLTLGVPKEAVRYYETLQQQRPYDEQLLSRLAHASLNLHQPDQALFWLEHAQADTDNVSLLRLQAQLLFSLKRYAEAVELFERLTRLEKDSGATWLMQGYAAWNGEMWAQARRALNRAQRYPQQRKKAKQLLHQLDVIESR